MASLSYRFYPNYPVFPGRKSGFCLYSVKIPVSLAYIYIVGTIYISEMCTKNMLHLIPLHNKVQIIIPKKQVFANRSNCAYLINRVKTVFFKWHVTSELGFELNVDGDHIKALRRGTQTFNGTSRAPSLIIIKKKKIYFFFTLYMYVNVFFRSSK